MDPSGRKKHILVTGSAGFYCLHDESLDGTAWKNCETSKLKGADSANIKASYMPTRKTIVLTTEDGAIFRSKDSGDSFEAVQTPWPSGVNVNKMFGECLPFQAHALMDCSV